MHEFDDCFDTNFLCVLASIVGEDGVLMAEPMRDHTTFNIGGPADVMILPRTRDEVVRVLDICLTGGVPCKARLAARCGGIVNLGKLFQDAVDVFLLLA